MRDFQKPGRSPVFAANALCATSHPLASATAIRILQDGGNAVDAAIGAAVLLGICEPQMTGIGGDCFVLLKPAGEDRVISLNGSGRAPAALSSAALRDRGLTAIPVGGPEAVTIPGAIDAFCRLSADWGRLGLAETLAPAIRYAEEGVPVAPRVAFDWALAVGSLQGAARQHYLLKGEAPRPGQVFRAPGQAEVLRRIAATAAPPSTKARWPRTWWRPCAPWAASTRLTISPGRPATTATRCRARTRAWNSSNTRRTGRGRPPSSWRTSCRTSTCRRWTPSAPPRPCGGRGGETRLRCPQPLHRRSRPHHAARPHARPKRRRSSPRSSAWTGRWRPRRR
jgi:hypothetical protein